MRLRVVNVGGSEALSTALLLSALAWGVRLLRARSAQLLLPGRSPRPPPGWSGDGARPPGHAPFGRLSPAAFWKLLTQPPFPYLLLDVRSAEEEVLATAAASADGAATLPPPQPPGFRLRASEQELASLLRPASAAAWAAHFGGDSESVALPPPQPCATTVLVFASPDAGAAARRAAALAAALGFLRCCVLDGGLQALAAAQETPQPQPPGAAAPTPSVAGTARPASLSRQALALLLLRGEGGVAVVDVRRCDERALFGGPAGSTCLPAERLPRALAQPPYEWARTQRFPRPGPGDAVVVLSRGERRARFCAQLFADAGAGTVLVLRDGTQGWSFDPAVRRYRAFAVGDAPPEPEPEPQPARGGGGRGRQASDRAAAEDELSRLGLI